MRQFSLVRILAALLTAVCLSLLAGCGGSTTTTPIAAKILLFPTTVSLNEGDVTTISAIAQSSSGATVSADITFTSSNPSIATISAGGSICAGVWDSNFIVCNATIGQGGVGQVTITAASGGVNATLTVYVHEKVDRLLVNPLMGCTTMGQVVNASASAFNTSAPGCSPAAPCDITSTVGPIFFGSNDRTIATNSSGIGTTYSPTTNSPTYTSGGTITGSTGQTCNLSNFNGVIGASANVALTSKNTIASGTPLTVTASGSGGTTPPTTATLSNGSATCSGTATVITALAPSSTVTAATPGATTIFANISGLNSPGAQYETCRVKSIMVHDASSSNISFTLTTGGTQPLTADVLDTNSQSITPPLTWGSSAIASAKVAAGTGNAATLTAVAPGTAYITASCSNPDCNKNVGAQYSLNVATAAVSGGTTTTVYAASTNSLSLIPISTSTNTAGTPITLPFPPTSIVADPAGTTIILGSASSGLMAVNVSTGVVATYSVFGTIEAISPDGRYLLLSYPPTNSVYYFDAVTLTTVFTHSGDTTNSAAFTPDSKLNEWLDGTQLGVVIPAIFVFNGTMLSYTGNALDISGQGGLTYITATTPNGIDVRSTCDQSEVQTLSANSPTLIKAIPNGTGAIAADSPAIDVVTTGTVQAGCPPAALNSVASFDMGAGPFNARQIFFSSNSADAWIVSDLPELLIFDLTNLAPISIPLAGGTTAFNGGVTLDGTQVYVGASDGTVHRIDVASNTDAQQIAVGLKDASGNAVAPNLVYVVP